MFHKSKLKKMATFQKLIELHEKNQKLKLDAIERHEPLQKFKTEVLEKWNKEIEAAGENFCFPFEFKIEVPDELKKIKKDILFDCVWKPIDNSLMIGNSDYILKTDVFIVSQNENN